MRPLFLSCALLVLAGHLLAQGQPSTSPPPQTTPPRPAPATGQGGVTPTPPAAPQTPAPRRAPAPAARGGLIIFATDMAGAPLGGVRVLAVGPTERSGTTDPSGQLRITGMQAGTYRLRFSSDTVVEFEREVTVRGGTNVEVDATLRPAPPPTVIREAAPPAPPPVVMEAPVGPVGRPQIIGVVDLIDRAFLQGPRQEAVVSCSGNTRVTLVQMSQDQATRLYEDAEVTYYVLGGEGTVRIDNRDTAIKQDNFVSVPRGTPHSIAHRGRRPLVLIAHLSGEPCEQPR